MWMENYFLKKSLMLYLPFLILLLSILFFPFDSAAQEVFQLLNTPQPNVINAQQLRDNNGFGSVMISVNIKNGIQENLPKIVKTKPRIGDEVWFQSLVNIISNWQFSEFGNGQIQYRIDIPSRGNPRIEINLEGLHLIDYKSQTVGLSNEQARNLVAAVGFENNIIIVGKPDQVQVEEISGIRRIKITLIDHLGVFGPVFIILIILLFIVVFRNWLILYKKWAPVGEFSSNPHGPVEKPEKELNFNSPQAKEVRDLWLRAMDLSGLEGSIIEKLNTQYRKEGENKLDREKIKKVIRRIEGEENIEDVNDLKSLLSNNHLLDIVEEALNSKFDDGMQLTELKKEVDKFLTSVQMIDEKVSNKEQWFGLDSQEQTEYSKRLWSYFGEKNVNKALEICNQVNPPSEKPKFALFDIFASGLHNHYINGTNWWASQEIDRSIDRTAMTKINERSSYLDSLWAIAGICPMVGLLGTVVGISFAFGKIKNVPDPKFLMQQLAGDINIALSTTIDGLILGLLAVIIYYIFKFKMDAQADRINKYFTDITNKT